MTRKQWTDADLHAFAAQNGFKVFTPNASNYTDAAGCARLDDNADDGRCLMAVSDEDMEVLESRGAGYHGDAFDHATKTKWKVFGASCGLPRCMCAARVERVS